ncbi:DNA repair protein RadA [Immundisolibacter cernigliae]|uniref:DNA repair protein RadA n=1 Tax=Immundisolibacter cernigliae TaxID=1810504 RepID=A0A1B1YTK1_9GAMM|nr:DNA repair protein RadA [Immundisolibacter cernigliae]ANX04052.1 DNA repair protein RadA [Immundisolibacter cernigliae]
MARDRSLYRCAECGASFAQWAGQCTACQAWNSLVEQTAAPAVRGGARQPATGWSGERSVVRLREARAGAPARLATGSSELDRVLGGGLVPGSVVLLGGDPGIGKSTLLLQTLARLADSVPVLYASGEESAGQIAARAQRLQLGDADLPLLIDARLEAILDAAADCQVLVVDSIQTLFAESVASAAGSVSQVRECAARLTRMAKTHGISVLIAGHVTKDGALAGPRVLEHIVDTVLYFEGDSTSPYRIVRAFKNRFGSVNELGVFAMTETGLREVSNPSAIFLTRHPRPVAGSVVMATLEGTRPLLLEVQALVESSPLGTPRRLTLGMDGSRLAMLLAVLHRHAGVALFDQDVYVNLVGGIKVTETATDLPVLLAALSSLRNRPLPADLLSFGEVGLAGEVRPVRGGQERLGEAAKLGFKRAVVGKLNAPRKAIPGLEVLALEHLGEIGDVFAQLVD